MLRVFFTRPGGSEKGGDDGQVQWRPETAKPDSLSARRISLRQISPRQADAAKEYSWN